MGSILWPEGQAPIEEWEYRWETNPEKAARLCDQEGYEICHVYPREKHRTWQNHLLRKRIDE